MRHWIFHPLIFYPLALIVAGLLIVASVKPQAWPRAPAPVAGVLSAGALVFEGPMLNSPDHGAEQEMTVKRDFWGTAQSLLLAQLPNQPPPTPAEQGVRILLTDASAALIDDKPVLVEVRYNPLPINAASALAVSLQGIGPADWISQPAPPQPGVLNFELPPQFAANAIGLRALSEGTDQAYGLEIIRVRVVPHAAAAPPERAPAALAPAD
jgi:hypothetical protein